MLFDVANECYACDSVGMAANCCQQFEVLGVDIPDKHRIPFGRADGHPRRVR